MNEEKETRSRARVRVESEREFHFLHSQCAKIGENQRTFEQKRNNEQKLAQTRETTRFMLIIR